MVKPLPVAHLHDFTLEIFHSGVGAAVLAALPCVGWSVHVGQKRDFINSQGVDDDMHMDIAAVVVSVRMGADKCLMSVKVFLAVGKPPTPASGQRSGRCRLRHVGQR